MSANPDLPIMARLKQELENRGVSVVDFERETGIDKDKVYKWLKRETKKIDPAEADKIESWISGQTSNNVQRGNYNERSLNNLTESNKVLAEANKTLAEANKTLAEANHVISKNHDELIQLTKLIVGIHGKPSKKEDLREKTKKPTHS